MSSLKDAAAELQLSFRKQPDMSVTPPVSHVEMWPYVARRPSAPRPPLSLIAPSCRTTSPHGVVPQHQTPRTGRGAVEHRSSGGVPRADVASPTHQPRSWRCPKTSASIVVTPEMSHAPMSSPRPSIPRGFADAKQPRHVRHAPGFETQAPMSLRCRPRRRRTSRAWSWCRERPPISCTSTHSSGN